jgi:Mrp family chromosome partitioning ATPase
VETFRLLALNIQRLIGGSDRRAIVVLSAWPDDGRSLVCQSLARALSEIMPPVLLVDADPAGAGVNGHAMPGSRNGSGHIEEVLAPQRDALKTPLTFLHEVHDGIEKAVAAGRTVVIDTPPCTMSSIAFYLASSATGALYVARRRAQDNRVHADIRAQLDLLGTPILGVAFNEG